jgi:quinol monooxygenase YgiN
MAGFGMFGKFTAAPGQRDALLGLLRESAALVHEAPGCEAWIVHTAPDDPDGIWVYERWRSETDHDASLTDERIRDVIGRAMPLIAGISDQVKLEVVD